MNVVDTTIPVITLIGTGVTIVRNALYTDSGATASDNLDGDITLNIVENGSVVSSGLGAYTLTYNVTDASGNTAILRGRAYKEETSVDELKHFAEDAGKSAEEIAAITEPVTELKFMADGVIIQ